jgi:hypothetical protein
MELMTITQSDVLELASELSHNATKKSLNILDSVEMYIEDENGNHVYKDDVQDEFDYHYDYYLTMIEQTLNIYNGN